MKPFDPRLLKAAGQTRYFLAATVAIALVATVGTLVVAYALTQFVVGVFVDKLDPNDLVNWLALAIAAALLRAGAVFLAEVFGYRTSRGIKAQFRNQALSRVKSGLLRRDSGALSQLIGPGLDALDGYFGKFLPQLVFSVIVTPIFVVVIFSVDAISGISILLTLPLIPLFMVLIGLVTKDVQAEQLKATTALSSHFLEVLRGLTTLKIFGRVQRQIQILKEVSTEQKRRTMKVLRLSFLSGFALELAASLSVALIAVQIGLRLVEGTMPLATGLFVLLLAPEVYLPLRGVGVQFHNSQSGVAATSELIDILSEREVEAAFELSPQPGLTALVGTSGSGKSSALRALIGPSASWMPQGIQLVSGSVLENIVGFSSHNFELASELLRELELGELSLEMPVTNNQGLSGGQAQRIMLARALYRLKSQNLELLLLDEPASMLDEKNQAVIVGLLKRYAQSGVRVVVATHQKTLIEAADTVVRLDAQNV